MSPEEANVEDYQWYRLVEGSAPLVQGDMLDGCPVVVPKAGEEGDEMVSEIHYYDVVVMSQSCDLEHDKVRLVLVCPVWPLESLAKRSVQLASRKGKENLRRGHFPGYHLLHECNLDGIAWGMKVADFHTLYGVPIESLREVACKCKKRVRLLPPYREHLSQALARFFMRVGLPTNIPSFV